MTKSTAKCKSCGKRYKLGNYINYTQEELETCFTCIKLKEMIKLTEQSFNTFYQERGVKMEVKLSYKATYTGTQK